jgi:flagella basal body P-ring formation protein FlgA
MKIRTLSLALLFGLAPITTAFAAEVTATITLQRGHIIEAGDIAIKGAGPSAEQDMAQSYIGQQMRRTIYAGAKLNPSHVDKPTLVKRNTRINMIYRVGRLEMTASGRALDEGGSGDIISVMNLDSKRRVEGLILANGSVEVTK